MLDVARYALSFYIIRAAWLKQFQPLTFVLTSNLRLQKIKYLENTTRYPPRIIHKARLVNNPG